MDDYNWRLCDDTQSVNFVFSVEYPSFKVVSVSTSIYIYIYKKSNILI